MTRASIPTLLALDRFAMILGINPAHFSGAANPEGVQMPVGGCSDAWFQFSWQSGDRVGREDLALAIANAEEEIAEQIGFWPAPKWIVDEVHEFPRYHRRDHFGPGVNVRGMRKSIIADWGKIVDIGQRNLTEIGEATEGGPATLVYTPADLTARITLPLPAGLADFNTPCEVKVYFDGETTPEWEIRPARAIEITGAGNVIIDFWMWQLIDPDLQESFPTTQDGVATLVLTDAIYVDTVDVYRVFNDNTLRSAEFFWEAGPPNILSGIVCVSCGGMGCVDCSLTTQDGCIRIRDVHTGIVVPVPATYDDDDEQWEVAAFTECREPDQVKIWYQAGDLDQRYQKGRTCDPLSNFWAEAIAWLATARLERNLCSCSNVTKLATNLRVDLSASVSGGTTYLVSEKDLENPFGTLRGEVKAWKRIKKFKQQRIEGVLIL